MNANSREWSGEFHLGFLGLGKLDKVRDKLIPWFTTKPTGSGQEGGPEFLPSAPVFFMVYPLPTTPESPHGDDYSMLGSHVRKNVLTAATV